MAEVCNTSVIFQDDSYTNERIMNFLQTSNVKMTTDSLFDLLQAGGSRTSGDASSRRQRSLNCSFYISEHLGEYLECYFKILNSKIINN